MLLLLLCINCYNYYYCHDMIFVYHRFLCIGAYDEDGRGMTIWDKFSHTKGKTEKNENGDIACDHYHR